jgi:hypothetical protein
MAKVSASTESSPRREEMTSPSTPTWSPRSTSRFQAASAASPTRSAEIITCISPVPSRIIAKHSLPLERDSITRPATPTLSPVAAPGARSGYRSWICAIVSVRGKLTG